VVVYSPNAVLKRKARGHYFLASGLVDYNSEKAVFVFIHGAFAWSWYWEHILAYIGGLGSPGYAKDLISHGRAPMQNDLGSLSVLDYVEDLRSFIERVVIPAHPGQPIVLVGHSMGGLVAMKLAETMSLHGLLLVSPAPPAGIEYQQGETLAVSLSERMTAGFATLFGRHLLPSKELFISSLSYLANDPMEMERVLKQFVPESSRAGREIFLGEIDVDASKIVCPKLVMVGEEDNVTHPLVAKDVANFLGAPLVTVSDVGHMLVYEPGWEDVAKKMVAWVDGIPSRV
jgi:pimeloyl-ACP methyl ester carboxylesterase